MSTNLYKLLNINRGSSFDDIRRSYKKLAIKYHPDKTGLIDDKFKEIAHAYSILSDPESRSIYDNKNIIDTEVKFFDVESELQNFFASYANSSEEYDDIMKLYNYNYGDFKRIMDNVLFENTSDGEVDRIYNIIIKAQNDKKIKITQPWKNSTTNPMLKKIKNSLGFERHKADTILKSSGCIQHVGITMNNIVDNITSKYCPEIVNERIEYSEDEPVRKKARKEKK